LTLRLGVGIIDAGLIEVGYAVKSGLLASSFES
jgi:hypothetical protein